MPAPPYSGGKDHAHQAELAEFLDGGQGELAGLVPLHDVGSDLALGELAHAPLQVELFFVELEIQGASGDHGIGIATMRLARSVPMGRLD